MVLNSTYHVALINLQRYLAVCYPFRYIRLATVKRLTLLFISMEVLFFGISYVFSPGPGFPLTNFMTSWCRHKSIDYIEIDGATLGKSAFITFAVFGILFLIPFVSLTCMNIRLLVIATRASRRQQHVVSVGVRNDQESTNASSSTPGLKAGADPGFLRGGGAKFEIMRAKYWYVMVTNSDVMRGGGGVGAGRGEFPPPSSANAEVLTFH